LSIADAIEAAGLGRDELKLEIGVFGAEPWTGAMRDEIQRRLGIVAINMYGLSEIIGTGVPLPNGEEGELVFTTLTKEALPILRYRTHDISSLMYEPCVCGRTTVRMSRIQGRYDDMLIIRGVNLYPSEVEHILLSVENVAPHYQLVVERPDNLDQLSLLCEPAHDGVDTALLHQQLERLLRERTGLSIAVKVLLREQVPRSEGKAVRVIDRRAAQPERARV
jgi:phenylacetate-CoA ligase